MRAIHYLSIFVIAAVFSSCSKGDTGETGPQGPAGLNGNANVSVTNYIIDPTAWSSNSNGGWEVNLTPAFDPTQGAVTISFSNDNTNWFGLPYVGNVTNDPDINYIINSSDIEILYVPQTASLSIAAPANTEYVKVTLVPQAIQKRYPGTNWKNAAEVAKIPEVATALNNSGK